MCGLHRCVSLILLFCCAVAQAGAEGEGNPDGLNESVFVEDNYGIGTGDQTCAPHSLDDNPQDWIISLPELLRGVQFFNSGGYHCADIPADTEDGYAPGYDGNHCGSPHSLDFSPPDFRISTWEMVRGIQLYNSAGFNCTPNSDSAPVLAVSHAWAVDGETGYLPGESIAITVNLSQISGPEDITALGVMESFPQGWTYNSLEPANPNRPDIHPMPGSTGKQGFSWFTQPALPFSFTYHLTAADVGSTASLSGRAMGRAQGIGGITDEDLLQIPKGSGHEDTYGVGLGDESCLPHSLDYNPQDWQISLGELLRGFQFFNSGGYHCGLADGTEDGWAPGSDASQCGHHSLDFSPTDYKISAWELGRAIQFYNSTGFNCTPNADPAPVLSVSHSRPPADSGYIIGDTYDITVTVDRVSGPENVTAIGLIENLPDGWSFDSFVTSDFATPTSEYPVSGPAGQHEFVWLSPPLLPFSFTYRARTFDVGDFAVLRGRVFGRASGVGAVSEEDSLSIPRATEGEVSAAEMLLERTVSNEGRFTAGSFLDITLSMTYTGNETVTAFAMSETLPDGWSYVVSDSGAIPEIQPQAGSTGNIMFAYITPPVFPFTFTYRIVAPNTPPSDAEISGYAEYRTNGGSLFSNQPTNYLTNSDEDPMTYTRSFGAAGYSPGTTLDINVTATYSGVDSILSLGVEESLPPGWTFREMVTGSPQIIPPAGTSGTIDFAWIIPPTSPVSFTYRVNVPALQDGNVSISGHVLYSTGGQEQSSVTETSRISLLASGEGEGQPAAGFTVYVSETKGSNETGDGTSAKPWRTIAFAVQQVKGLARPDFPVTIQLDDGVYLETVDLSHDLRLVGSEPLKLNKAIISPLPPQLKADEATVGVEAAENTEIRDLTIQLPVDSPVWSTALRIDGVASRISNCVIDCGLAPESIGLAVLKPESSASEITDSLVTRCFYGIRAIDTNANFSRNTFQSIEKNAVTVYNISSNAKGVSPATPLLGDAALDASTGSNHFSNVSGYAINNLNPAETLAQINYWDTDNEGEILASVSGLVNVNSFLKSGPLAVTFVLTLLDSDSAPITGATFTTLPPGGQALESPGGVYTFNLTSGIYSFTVKAEGYADRTFVRDLQNVGNPIDSATRTMNKGLLDRSKANTTDQDRDGIISLGEVLRVIQLYNGTSYHCDASSQDGFASGPGDTASCPRHDADFQVKDWKISLSELLRLVQLYTLRAYRACPGTGSEDGFCAS